MAYFIEYHRSGKWETNDVSTLYLAEWLPEEILNWFEETFWDLERSGVSIADVLEDDEVVHSDEPPASRFYSWAPFEDERTVCIWKVD